MEGARSPDSTFCSKLIVHSCRTSKAYARAAEQCPAHQDVHVRRPLAARRSFPGRRHPTSTVRRGRTVDQGTRDRDSGHAGAGDGATRCTGSRTSRSTSRSSPRAIGWGSSSTSYGDCASSAAPRDAQGAADDLWRVTEVVPAGVSRSELILGTLMLTEFTISF